MHRGRNSYLLFISCTNWHNVIISSLRVMQISLSFFAFKLICSRNINRIRYHVLSFFVILIFFTVSTNLLSHLDPCLFFLLPMGITNNVLHMYFTQYKSSVLNKYLKYISYNMNEYWVHWTLLSYLCYIHIHWLYLK